MASKIGNLFVALLVTLTAVSAHAGCREDLMAANMAGLDESQQVIMERLVQANGPVVLTASESQWVQWAMNMAQMTAVGGPRGNLMALHKSGPRVSAVLRRLKNAHSAGSTLVLNADEIEIILERVVYSTNGSPLAMDPETPSAPTSTREILATATAAPPQPDPTLYVMHPFSLSPQFHSEGMGYDVHLIQYYVHAIEALESALQHQLALDNGRIQVDRNYGVALAYYAQGMPLGLLATDKLRVLNAVRQGISAVPLERDSMALLLGTIRTIRLFHELRVQDLRAHWEYSIRDVNVSIYNMLQRDLEQMIRARLNRYNHLTTLTAAELAVFARITSFRTDGSENAIIPISRGDMTTLLGFLADSGR